MQGPGKSVLICCLLTKKKCPNEELFPDIERPPLAKPT